MPPPLATNFLGFVVFIVETILFSILLLDSVLLHELIKLLVVKFVLILIVVAAVLDVNLDVLVIHSVSWQHTRQDMLVFIVTVTHAVNLLHVRLLSLRVIVVIHLLVVLLLELAALSLRRCHHARDLHGKLEQVDAVLGIAADYFVTSDVAKVVLEYVL